MSSRTIKVIKIGEIDSNSHSTHTQTTIQFNGKWYKTTANINASSIYKDVELAPGFSFQTNNENNGESLWLTYKKSSRKRAHSEHEATAIRKIIQTFFITESNSARNNNDKSMEVDSNQNNVVSVRTEHSYAAGPSTANNAGRNVDVDERIATTKIGTFYQQLREEHLAHDKFAVDYSDGDIQHKHMKPQLKPYQINAVKWMLHRELTIDSFPSEFKPIETRWPTNDGGSQTFFFNFHTLELSEKPVSGVSIPSGGILADEMGLGKTVETLSLILLNRRFEDQRSAVLSSDDDDDGERPRKRQKMRDISLKCKCHEETAKKTIKCIRCLNSQHRACVSQPTDGVVPDDEYICPWCWEKESVVTAKTTLIVSPLAIKMQWMDEVKKHIGDQLFKICVYDGWRTWRNPKELASYDVILTDYETLEKEFTYSQIPRSTRTLRTKRCTNNYQSPLLSVNWWRICLDEAQMVASVKNRPAQIVAQLTSVHRWAITGTPIERTIHDLYGLIHYLGCSPYNELDEWEKLVDESDVKPLLSVLRRIMWRTCKTREVASQLDIPDQTELVHYIDMKDVERINYKTNHEEQFTRLQHNLREIDENVQLSTIDRSLLDEILRPLCDLCLYCTTPYLKKDQKKKLMKPNELLKHLQDTNVLVASMELYEITELKNTLAALNIRKGHTAAAIDCYKDVLQLAEDYEEKLGVADLPLIHAIHNLIAIEPSIKKKDRKRYKNLIIKNEWMHLGDKFENLLCAQVNHYERNVRATKLHAKYTDNQWFVDTLNRHDFPFDRVLDYASLRYLLNGIQLQLTKKEVFLLLNEWLANLFHEQQVLRKHFNDLQFFMNNLKPLSNLDGDTKDEMDQFLLEAFECHKFTAGNSTAEKAKCKVCLAKRQLEVCTLVIFDQQNDSNAGVDLMSLKNDGSMKQTYQEMIFNLIERENRKSGEASSKAQGKALVELLCAIKMEFWACLRLWKEVNATVMAYVQINISKDRPVIPMKQIDSKLVDTQTKLAQVNTKFKLLIWKSKYLEQLEETKELQDCPICLDVPNDRYVMLRCCHTVCAKCFRDWTKTVVHGLECPVCRNNQRVEEIYYVNVEDQNRLTDASSRIEGIVQKVVELKNDDPAVKIVIFTHSFGGLSQLGKQLTRNNLSAAYINSRSQLKELHGTINRFKDPTLNITCLLLPLELGSKGLNLLEATHIFLVEPIICPSEELQAINRIHRIGQTRKTYVHRFIMNNTVEESIYNGIPNGENGFWVTQKCTAKKLLELFESTKLEIIDL